MNFLFITLLIASAFTASADSGIDIVVSKVDGDLDFSCKAVFTPSGASSTNVREANNLVYFIWSDKTSLADGDTASACSVKSPHGTNFVLNNQQGTCYNVSYADPMKETAWTADEYSFNCTDKAVVNTDVHGSTCTLYFDSGKGSLKDVNFKSVTDAKTYIYTVAAGATLTSEGVPHGALVNGSITVPAEGSECEDHSGSLGASIASAIALVGAATFF